jgi:hypothetical protein
MSSVPARTLAADRKDLKPSMGRVTRLMARWSWSTMLLRYLTWRTTIAISLFSMIESMAALLAPLLSIVTFSGTSLARMASSRKTAWRRLCYA